MNQVILNTDTVPIIYNVTDNYHTTKMDPILIKSVDVGENVNAYGRIIMNFEGVNKTNFLHFKKGIHVLEPPVMFLSFHIDKIDKKKYNVFL
jgi:hypothetical protein